MVELERSLRENALRIPVAAGWLKELIGAERWAELARLRDEVLRGWRLAIRRLEASLRVQPPHWFLSSSKQSSASVGHSSVTHLRRMLCASLKRHPTSAPISLLSLIVAHSQRYPASE